MKLLVIVMYLFHLVVDFILARLNDLNLNKPLPDNVKGIYSKQKYEKYLAYKKDYRKVNHIEDFFNCLIFMILIYFDLYAKIYSCFHFNIYVNSILLFVVIEVISLPVELISDIYKTFVIEEKYGFNKTTKKTYIIDFIKNMVLSLILMSVIVCGLIFFYSTLKNTGLIIAFILFIVFILIININSLRVMKIFNTFKPLDEGELKNRIIALCEEHGLIVRSIVVMDASTRTTRANAFCTGLGNRKDISLDDNLINLFSEDEIVAVFSHEIGHATHNHIYRNLITSMVRFALYFVVIAFLLNTNYYTSFGFDSLNYTFMIEIFSIVIYPFNFIYDIISNVITRQCEREADLFAYQLGYGEALINALKKLNQNDLINLNPHPFVVFCEYSHPTLSQRIELLERGTLK